MTQKLNNLESEEIIEEEAIEESKRRLAHALDKLKSVQPRHSQLLIKSDKKKEVSEPTNRKSKSNDVTLGKTKVPIALVTAMATTMSAEQAEIASLRRRLRDLESKIPKSPQRILPTAAAPTPLVPASSASPCSAHNCSVCNTSCGQLYSKPAHAAASASARHAALLALASKVARILRRSHSALPAKLTSPVAALAPAHPANASRPPAAPATDPALQRIAEEVVRRKERSLQLQERAMRRRMRQMSHWSQHLVHGEAPSQLRSAPPPQCPEPARARRRRRRQGGGQRSASAPTACAPPWRARERPQRGGRSHSARVWAGWRSRCGARGSPPPTSRESCPPPPRSPRPRGGRAPRSSRQAQVSRPPSSPRSRVPEPEGRSCHVPVYGRGRGPL